ncbi:uncharacterized protein CC84DRAFT_411 [Paraphaeosphaeria sporulosa]|uniref:Protein kinase domain-containing protein n=1 Tax=Paraphaeosphaeria sporulosa TaxID=1460663 RepID=A0A177CUG5_9PLEO|nr:uncharacterized protein CC84DRAFT_411 [Paraphaeosphaeria sporulosa]OAG11163.1 hypothetical protein CC84DRAFT_411 [Paraphaeosphaeria sporulosa]
MSGLEIPGLVVGVVPLALKATVEAWKVLDDTVSFSDDSEDLVIRLETLKAHLGIWAMKAGLTEGGLLSALLPFEELIERTLKRICELVTEVELQGTKYGLKPPETGSGNTKRTNAAIVQMRKSLHAALSNTKSPRTNIAVKIEADAARIANPERKDEPNVLRRICWAVHDKQKFEGFVNTLEKHVNGLQNFVVDHDRRKLQQEGTRITLDIIRGLSEPDALIHLRGAPIWDDQFSQMDISTLARWKAIAVTPPSPPVTTTESLKDWSLASIHADDRSQVRFIKRGLVNNDAAYFFEKKEYDPNITDDEKDILQDRIRQLMALLGEARSQRHLNTLQALGYLDDPSYHCWWIVFRFPLSPLDVLDDKANRPLSLKDLYSVPYRPALEARYRLAKRLVDSFARLYGSDWYHKGINSSNIIFPQIYTASSRASFKSINTALVQGFNYSRQLTQSQTIDRGKVLNDLEAAIYRHPLYQGDAASGYQIQYDIYSLGLVLFEIAIWGPLMDMFVPGKGKKPPVALSPNMKQFHEAEAFELKRRIDMRVENELAYRVGTRYKEVVQWCLSLRGTVTALEFYNAVAIPLDELCSQ